MAREIEETTAISQTSRMMREGGIKLPYLPILIAEPRFLS